MKNRSVFPYRRNGGKSRSKPAAQRQGRDQRNNGSAAHNMLSVLQPTTKALAQMLAGNTKASGQLKHAKSVLQQAQRLVDTRGIDRLSPSQREEYLELLARLKLTLTDANEMVREPEAEAPEPAVAKPPIDRDRLRALALSIATTSSKDLYEEPTAEPEEEDEPEAEMTLQAEDTPSPSETENKTETSEPDPEDPSKNGKRGKLRLKPARPDEEPSSAKAGL